MGDYTEEKPLQIVDATAGLGRESLIISIEAQRKKIPFKMTMLERNPILHYLLRQSLQESLDKKGLRDVAQNMFVEDLVDSIDYLQNQNSTQPDIVIFYFLFFIFYFYFLFFIFNFIS